MKKATQKTAFDLAGELMSAMESGTAFWQKPWGRNAPVIAKNLTTGKSYRAGNQFWLQQVASKNGWGSTWLSFKEIQKLGGSIKGHTGTKIEKPFIKKEVDQRTGEEKETLLGFSSATVFNTDQVDGVDFESLHTPVNAALAVDTILENLQAGGLKMVTSADGVCSYDGYTDTILMATKSCFVDSFEYYANLAHQMTHASLKTGRYEREFISYAYEEVRAEMAASLLCANLGLPRTQAHINNHAGFISAWLDEFADKKKTLLKAASEAQGVCDYLLSLSVNRPAMAA